MSDQLPGGNAGGSGRSGIATHAYMNLPRATRRRLLRRALLRPTLSAAVLFVLYFTLPMDRGFSGLTLVALVAGLCVVAGLIVFQTRAIMRSPYPRLTAITALAFSVPLFVLSFATVYFLMEHSEPRAFTEPMTRLDALYFTVTVLSSVGFGDIAARSQLARVLTIVQMLGDLLLIVLAVRILANAVQTGLASRDATNVGKSAPQSETSADP